jgi:hypothetical protein
VYGRFGSKDEVKKFIADHARIQAEALLFTPDGKDVWARAEELLGPGWEVEVVDRWKSRWRRVGAEER